MKSKFAVVIGRKGTPRLRTTETAFRKTSGRITAEPQFRYTPPGCISFTSAQKRRKSRCVALPSAALRGNADGTVTIGYTAEQLDALVNGAASAMAGK